MVSDQMKMAYWMVFIIIFALFFVDHAVSSEEEMAVSFVAGSLQINGLNMSLPDGVDPTGNGTLEDPYIFSSIWINNTDGPGIWINGSSSHIIIRDTYVTNGIFNRSDGVFISNSTNVTLADSLVQGCYIGVNIDNSSGINLIGSSLSGNRYGVILRNSPGNELTDCSMNGNMIDGVIVDRSEDSIISFCEFRSNSARIANDAAIRIVRSSRIIVQGCILQMNYGTGIYLQGPMDGCFIIDCDINYNNEGIIARNVTDLKVHGIEFIINMKVMELQDLDNCTFTDIFAYRHQYGIEMHDVLNCEFRTIELEGCGFGMDIKTSHLNLLNNITFKGSRSFDLVLGDPDDIALSSNDNLIHGNHFQIDHGIQPSVHDHGYGNLWHFNGSGNTWSGWEINDKDKDGIGDTPFMINGTAGSRDSYPRSDVIPGPGNVRYDEEIESGSDGSTSILILLLAVIITIVLFIILIMAVKKRENGG